MTGVLIGTVCSYGYRSFEIILYTNRHLIPGTAKTAFIRIIRNLIVTGVLISLGIWLIPQNMTSFIHWFIYAVASGIVSVVMIVGVNYVAEPRQFKNLILRIQGIVSRKKR